MSVALKGDQLDFTLCKLIIKLICAVTDNFIVVSPGSQTINIFMNFNFKSLLLKVK